MEAFYCAGLALTTAMCVVLTILWRVALRDRDCKADLLNDIRRCWYNAEDRESALKRDLDAAHAEIARLKGEPPCALELHRKAMQGAFARE